MFSLTRQVEMTGSKQFIGLNSNRVNSALTVRSPWKLVRDLSLTLNHDMSASRCSHSAALVHNGQKKASTDLNYRLGDEAVSGDFSLSTPYTEKKSGSVTAKFGSYPVTGHAELQVAPRSSVTGDVSFSKSGDTDTEGSLRITTPFRAIGTITLSGSTKRDGQDMLAKANLDYGARRSYDAEVRLRPDTLTLLRVKVHTPLEDFSSLDAGYQVSGAAEDFHATADLNLLPFLEGKYSGSLTWKLDDDLSAKLRVNTPLKDLQYMQLTANSQDMAEGRKSRLEAEYYPRKVYALTSFYTTADTMPIIFSLNAETPIPGYDSFGLSVKHQYDGSSINTHGEVQYLPDRVIEGTLALSWDRNVDGSLVVKTPFQTFEESKVSLRLDGDPDDFTGHAEMEMMRETLTADAQFKYGYTTLGTFSLTSSLDDLQKVEANFNKRGNANSFRSSAFVAYGDQKIQGNLQHRLNAGALKTTASFNSPFTKGAKSTVEFSSGKGSVQVTVSGQYGPMKVESKSAAQIAQPDLSATSSLTYQLDSGEPKEMAAAVSKKGEWDSLDLAASFTSPYTEDSAISVQHTSDLPRSLKTVLSGNYGRRYTVDSDNDFDSRSGGESFSASSSTKYRLGGPLIEASASLSKSGDISDMTVSAGAKYEGQEIDVNGELKIPEGGEVSVSLQASTPFSDFESLGLGLTYTPSDKGFSQRGSLTYMTDRKIQQSIDFTHDGFRSLQLDASLTSPIPKLESNSLKVRYALDESRKQCSGSAELESTLGKQSASFKRTGDSDRLTLEASGDLDGQTLDVTYNRLPISNGYKHDIELKGVGDVLKSSVEYTKTDEKISGKASVSMLPSSISMQWDASLVGSSAEVNSKASLTTATLQETATFSLKKTGDWDDVLIETQVGLSGFKAGASVEFKQAAEEVSGQLKLNSPFVGYKHIGGSFKQSGDLDRFNCQGGVTYMDDKEISGKVVFYRYQWRRVEATAEITTPFSGFESTKAEYRHAGSADSFTCSSFLKYGSGSQKISADLRASTAPKYDVTLTVKTPFRRFHKLVADAKLESLANTHTASASLDLGRGHGQKYAVDGSLDMDSTPMTMTGTLTTPLDLLRSVEVSGSHRGSIDDFSSSFVFNCPQTDVIKGDASLRYSSAFDVTGAASLSSQLQGMEDLKLELKTAGAGGSKTAHAMARWAPQRQVALDGTYAKKDYWYNKEMEADIALTTPFQAVRSANLHVRHEEKDKKYTPKMELTLNGKSLLDVEGELVTGDDPSASLTSTQPWPAQLTGSLTHSGDEQEGEVFVNWNRDKNDQNVRLQTKAKDVKDDYQRDMDYSLKVRLMGWGGRDGGGREGGGREGGEREREKERERQRGREGGGRRTETETDRERQTHRQTDGQRSRERQKELYYFYHNNE